MYFQVMTFAEAESLPYNPFDLTKVATSPSHPFTLTAAHLPFQAAVIYLISSSPSKLKNTYLLSLLNGHSLTPVPPFIGIGVVPLGFPPPRDRPHGPGQKPTELLRRDRTVGLRPFSFDPRYVKDRHRNATPLY
jgi:hypothetical protein